MRARADARCSVQGFHMPIAISAVRPWLLALALVIPSAVRSQGSTGLQGVIGHWTEVAEGLPIIVVDGKRTQGIPTITVDGTKWSGKTTADALQRASLSLFGGANELFVRNGSADGAFPLAVASAVGQFTGGTLRVQFSMLGGASDQNAGVVFNLQPTGEYLYARYNTKDGDLALWRFANGERQLIVHGTGSAKLPLEEWHELVVTIRDRELSASVDGVPALQLKHTLDTAISGRVGLWVKRDAVTAFRNFRVTPSGR